MIKLKDILNESITETLSKSMIKKIAKDKYNSQHIVTDIPLGKVTTLQPASPGKSGGMEKFIRWVATNTTAPKAKKAKQIAMDSLEGNITNSEPIELRLYGEYIVVYLKNSKWMYGHKAKAPESGIKGAKWLIPKINGNI